MSQTPFEQLSSLRIGSVDFVSPNEVKVVLDIEAPQSVALGVDGPRPFPRVNSYLIVPVDDGLLVGQVEWLVIDHSPFPKRRGLQDFGVVDLPYPLRKLRLNPLGTLRRAEKLQYTFRRGADAMPSVGAPVLLPTGDQLRAIVESGDRRRVRIGTSPIAGDAEVSVDPDRLFGRHLAVLGNTGSGKSCSVAGLIRWSLEKAAEAKEKRGEAHPNARFIILDPNGEYTRAFSKNDAVKARVFRVSPTQQQKELGEIPLQVPLWFWNSAEWSSFAQASAKTQRPLLQRALREVKAGRTSVAVTSDEEKKLEMRRYLSSRLISIRGSLRTGEIQENETKFGFRLKAIADDLKVKAVGLPGFGIMDIQAKIEETLRETSQSFMKSGKTVEYYRAFNEQQVSKIIEALEVSLKKLGGVIFQRGPSDNVPVRFRGTDLADHLEILATEENVTQYVDFLVTRIRTLLSDQNMSEIIDDRENITLDQWLRDYIGDNKRNNGCISVIDLSLVPTDVVNVVVAVIARMVFEALQRYMKTKGVALPTALVMEEAHTFVRKYQRSNDAPDAATICCQIFERIAREGRKFGLGLVLSSQRPSELSPTVLSQCNSFLLHRITNDRDQDLIQRLVPDNLRGLLRELPSLPSQNAILLGWASELPVLVRMDDLPTAQQPRSDDPEFWDVWTGEKERNISWEDIAQDWQAGSSEQQSEVTSNTKEFECDQAEGQSNQVWGEDEAPF